MSGRWVYDDGGREAAGYTGVAADCVTRAICIAFGLDYQTVYDDLASLQAGRTYTGRDGKTKTVARSARSGVLREVWKAYVLDLGGVWTPTMGIGSGCRVHLLREELPAGRLIVQVTKHTVAVIDGVIRDNHDPSRGGTRCVYGYFTVPS